MFINANNSSMGYRKGLYGVFKKKLIFVFRGCWNLALWIQALSIKKMYLFKFVLISIFYSKILTLNAPKSLLFTDPSNSMYPIIFYLVIANKKYIFFLSWYCDGIAGTFPWITIQSLKIIIYWGFVNKYYLFVFI